MIWELSHGFIVTVTRDFAHVSHFISMFEVLLNCGSRFINFFRFTSSPFGEDATQNVNAHTRNERNERGRKNR
jgi:hypothetical protein